MQKNKGSISIILFQLVLMLLCVTGSLQSQSGIVFNHSCWTKRPAYLMKQFSLLEIISTVVLLAIVVVVVVVDLSRVFHAVDSATLQVAHMCTPAPYGMLAVSAALPTIPAESDLFAATTLMLSRLSENRVQLLRNGAS